VEWDRQKHLYFNAGPARISHHHTGVLGYCREFDIPLEPFVNDNRAALLQTDSAFGGKPQPLRRVIMDGRGGIAALAAKAAGSGSSDLRSLLRAFGALQEDMSYAGTGGAGYKTPPGGGLQAGEPLDPLPLEEIARAVGNPTDPRVLNTLTAMMFAQDWDQSPTMLQPVGGMDAIPKAFARALGSTIKYRAQVVRIARQGDKGRVIWRERKSNQTTAIDADFVICTLPLPVLRSVASDFSEAVKRAIEIGAKNYVPAGKLAFYSSRRWWETDHQLYGGVSWTTADITQIWYPSHGFHEKNGILLGGYMWDAIGATFVPKTPAERASDAIKDGERLHPGYRSLVGKGASVAWPNVPFSEGAWCEWPDAERSVSYRVLVAGDGPFHFAGEHVSYVPGWQEGAVQSAHHAVDRIFSETKTTRL
jgi:monoamine oxidase